LEWDLSPSNKPVHATFSNHNLKITKISGEGDWNSPVIGSMPAPDFTIQIISGEEIMIGFCPIDKFTQNGSLDNACCFYACHGDVYYNGGDYKSYGPKLQANDKLTAVRNGTSIKFLKNGIDLGEALNNVEGEMYPVVELRNLGDSVMIVPNP
jgi:hypothetical protein